MLEGSLQDQDELKLESPSLALRVADLWNCHYQSALISFLLIELISFEGQGDVGDRERERREEGEGEIHLKGDR